MWGYPTAPPDTSVNVADASTPRRGQRLLANASRIVRRALRERDDTDRVQGSTCRSRKDRIAQIAPSVAPQGVIIWSFHTEEASVERLGCALRP
jgi:hypothetical protein